MDDLRQQLTSTMLTAAVEAARRMEHVTRVKVTAVSDTGVRMLVFFETYGPREFLLRLTEIW